MCILYGYCVDLLKCVVHFFFVMGSFSVVSKLSLMECVRWL